MNDDNNRSNISAPSTFRKESHHSFQWCHICGKEFHFVKNPVEQEKQWIVHYAGEHLIDEINDGSITIDDINELEQYFQVDQNEYIKNMVEDGVVMNDDQDPILTNTIQIHQKIKKRKFWFSVAFTVITFYIVWNACYNRYSSLHRGFKFIRTFLDSSFKGSNNEL
jgi:hypothetical protein